MENKALKALGDIIKRDYDGLSGLMMERYFVRKFQEEGRYIVGKWWDRKGFNEIDLKKERQLCRSLQMVLITLYRLSGMP